VQSFGQSFGLASRDLISAPRAHHVSKAYLRVIIWPITRHYGRNADRTFRRRTA
jgi:hypothetical protein